MNNDIINPVSLKINNKVERSFMVNLFIFIFSIYFLTASIYNIVLTDAGQLRIEVAKSIVERLDLSIPKGEGLKGIDGRDYSWLGIGSALMSVPFYMFAKLIDRPPEPLISIMNLLAGAATVVLVFLFSISLGFSRRAGFFTSIFYGLGTFAWPLAKQPFDNILETFFILLSVYCIYRYVINKKYLYLFFSGIFLGVAFITRMTSVLVILPLSTLIIYYYPKGSNFKDTLKGILKLFAKDFTLFSIAFLPFVCFLFWYNYYRFGNVFESGYQLIGESCGIEGLFVGTSLLTGLKGLLISPGKGFFYYSPAAILFFFSIKPFSQRNPGAAICFISIITTYLLFISKFLFWHGDFAWGPRYLLILTPFLIIPIAEIFDSVIWGKKSFIRKFISFIFVMSLAIQIAAISVDFQKYFNDLKVNQGVKFKVLYANGVQPIVEPPVETYFDWFRSPIIAQFRFVKEIAIKTISDKNLDPQKKADFEKKVEKVPNMNIFDFWWLYNFYINDSYVGFISALVLFLIAINRLLIIWQSVK